MENSAVRHCGPVVAGCWHAGKPVACCRKRTARKILLVQGFSASKQASEANKHQAALGLSLPPHRMRRLEGNVETQGKPVPGRGEKRNLLCSVLHT
jgi:hypothetical protein